MAFGRMGAHGGFGRLGALPVTDPTANNLSRDVLSINSLAGYWRATDKAGATTLKDYSASAHPATIAGGVTLGSTGLVTGSVATSALFNGTTGTASLGASGETAFHSTFEYNADWTVEALVNPTMDRTTNGENRCIFSKMNSNSPFNGLEISLQYSSGLGKSVVHGFLISNFGGGQVDEYAGNIDVPNGVVSHIMVSRKAGVWSIWVNGVLDTASISSLALGSNTTANSNNPQIGSRNGAVNFFKGNIQELAVYNVGGAITTGSLQASNVLSAGKPFYHYGLSLGRAPLAGLSVPNVILLTDLCTDIDDVGDLALACALHLRGEINLIGVITDSINDRSADTAYAIAKYMIPSKTTAFVGAWQGAVPAGPNSSYYTSDISATFGSNQGRASFTDGVQKARALLAANSNVVIVETGFSTILDGLLTSAANAGGDGLASGTTLISQSVKRFVLVQGNFPSGSGEFNNVNGPPANASDFNANCPVEIVFAGIENGDTISAGPPSTAASGTNPVQQAFHDWVAAAQTSPRPTWGMLGILFAARGVASGLEPAGLRGTNTVNSSTGANAWTWTAGNATYLRKSAADSAFVTLFNSMYSALPSAF